MKKIFILLIALFTGICGFTQNKGYVVKVKLNQPEKYKPVLSYFQPDVGKTTFDSTYTLESGWAVFKGVAKEPVLASINLRTVDGNAPSKLGVQFFLTNEEIIIEGNPEMMHKAEVTGGKINKEWERIKYKQQELRNDRLLALQASSRNEKDTALRVLLGKISTR